MTFSDNQNLAQQAEKIKFQITIEEPEEEEEDLLATAQEQYKHHQQHPSTNYSSSSSTAPTAVVTQPTANQMITTVDSNSTSKSPMTPSNYIVSTSGNQQFRQKDQDQFHHQTSSIHSKNSFCDDNQTQLEKSTSINNQQNTNR